MKVSNGSQAPIYTKQAQFRTRSITEAKISSSVCVLKWPSQEMAVPLGDQNDFGKKHREKDDTPAANAARRSSLPMVLAMPIVNRASARY